MWDGPTFQSYYIHIPQNVRAFLDGEDPSYLLTVDFEEYLDYLVDRYEWQTQEWDPDAKTIEPITVKIQKTAHNGRRYEELAHRFRLRIPLSPHPQRVDYFRFGPSTTRGTQPNFQFNGE